MPTEEIIKATHDAGFFSVCNINLITALDYFNRNNKCCKLDTSNQWSLYKDEPGDVYGKFFDYSSEPLDTEPQSYLDSDTEIQFSDYKLINYNFVNLFIQKYFRLNDTILQIKKDLINKYQINAQDTISVFYRGGDKHKETNLPTYEDMNNKLLEICQYFPDSRIIAQSDEIEFCDYINNSYSDVVVFDEVKKLNRDIRSAVQYHTIGGERVANHQTLLAIISIIADTRHIILNSGSVGLFSCLFRGNANNVHQYYSPLNSTDSFWY